MLLDGDKLVAYLDEYIDTFATLNGHLEPGTDGNDRVLGALNALRQVRKNVVEDGYFVVEGP